MTTRLKEILAKVADLFDVRLKPGEFIGPYKVEAFIAQGGMGLVYRVADTRLETESPRRVMKLISEDFLNRAGKQAVRRFELEANAIARLDDPGIVRLYEFHEAGHPRTRLLTPYMVLEYVPGEQNLESYLGGNRLSHREAARLVQECARAVGVAHQFRIIHRDLKPSNILLAPVLTTPRSEKKASPVDDNSDRSGYFPYRPKISDFGIAKTTAGGKAGAAESGMTAAAPVTQAGQVVGTLEYMAPELYAGTVTRRGDVWALGVILYRLLFGELPFTSLETDQQKRLEDFREQIQRWNPDQVIELSRGKIPTDLARIVRMCLQPSPRQRYSGGKKLAADLQAFLKYRPVKANPAGRWKRLRLWGRRRPALAGFWATMILLAAGMTAAAIVFNYQANREKEARKAEAEQREQAEYRAATLALEQGLILCDRGRIAEGVSWFVRGLDLAPSNAHDLRAAVQLNIAHWSNQLTPLVMTFPHRTRTNTLGFAPNGRLLVTGDDKGDIHFWNVDNGEHLERTLNHPHAVTTLAFSPDGNILVTGCANGDVYRWDLSKSGKPMILKGHNGSVTGISVSRDQKWILSGSKDGTARLWSYVTGEEVHLLRGHKSVVQAVAFGPAGRAATASHDGTARIWDVHTGKQTLELKHPGEVIVWSVAFSVPDGKEVMTGTFTGDVYTWDSKSGAQRTGAWKVPSGTAVRIAVHPNGGRLLTISEEGAQVWDVQTGERLGPFLIHSVGMHWGTWHPDGERLATTSDDGVRLWVAAKRLERLHKFDFAAMSGGTALRADGRRFAAGKMHKDGDIRVWEFGQDTWTAKAILPKLKTPVVALALPSVDDQLLIACFDGSVRSWDIEKKIEKWRTPAPNKNDLWSVRSLTLDHQGIYWAAGHRNGMLRVGRITDGAIVLTIPAHKESVTSVDFSPDGKQILTGSMDFTARLWHLVSGKPLGQPLQHNYPVSSVAIDPTGQMIATGGTDHKARLWDASTFALLGKSLTHPGEVNALAFNPNGKILLTACSDNKTRLWHVRTGLPIGPALSHASFSTHAVFHSKGRSFFVITDVPKKAKVVYEWLMPDVQASLEHIRQQFRLDTGLELGPDDSLRFLDCSAWKDAHQRSLAAR